MRRCASGRRGKLHWSPAQLNTSSRAANVWLVLSQANAPCKRRAFAQNFAGPMAALGDADGLCKLGNPALVQRERSETVPYRFSLSLAVLLCAVPPALAEPLFPNSVVSNDLDFIREDEPGANFCLRYEGVSRAEMVDKRHDNLFADDVLIFNAIFDGGKSVGIWVHPDVGDKAKAETLIDPVIRAVARLPEPMRNLLSHVVIHEGNETAFAEDLGRFFVMYSENIRSRIATNDISETVFHESVHATLDVPHASSAEWIAAQTADGQFVTEYAAEHPGAEDMAESALLAWAMLKYPGRLPPEVDSKVAALMPNRLAYFESLFANWEVPRPQTNGTPC